jgi:ATP-dependent RNA helicase RhlB
MEFSEINLHPDLQRGISEAGYLTCMPVQEQVLTNAFGGQDLYVQSQTGTGKTAAFLIVIFQRLLTEPLLNGRKAIIMVPTRELAVQVEEEAKILGKYLSFKTGSFYGGVGYTLQRDMLRDNVQILVGTPGRVLDLNHSGQMNLMDIAFLVIDEADRMFDMGFYPDLRKLISVVPPADRRQTMLFSATLNARVKNLAWEYTKNPFEIEIAPETVTVDEVEQVLYHVPSADKMRLLMGILRREQPESAIIFCNTKRYTEIIAKRMKTNGYDTQFIIGDLPQQKRLKIIEDIKAGKLRYLAATDVAARGLDIEGLAMVINYDIPNEAENYVHRIGRTARAGKTGKAVTLCSEQDVYELPSIEKYIGKKIPSVNATEELYDEDKSAGMKIRSEFYENRSGRDGERNSPGGPRRGGGRDRGRGRDARETSRPERRRGGANRGPGDESRERPPRAERGAPPRNSRAGRPPETGNAGEGRRRPELSKLSFEERMAYYRKKYDKPEAPEKGGSRDQNPDRRPQRPGRDGEERKPAKRGGGRGGRGGQADRQKTGPARGAGAEKTAPVPPGGTKQGGRKKGILTKLLGIFKKGK